MNIYLLERLSTDFEQLAGIVVVAGGHDEAREMARKEEPDESDGDWLNPELTTIKYLGASSDDGPSVVLVNVNWV